MPALSGRLVMKAVKHEAQPQNIDLDRKRVAGVDPRAGVASRVLRLESAEALYRRQGQCRDRTSFRYPGRPDCRVAARTDRARAARVGAMAYIYRTRYSCRQ